MAANRKLPYAASVAAMMGLAGPLAQAQTPAAVAHGKAVAERVCSGCHAIDDRPGNKVQGTDVPSFRAIAGRPNRTPASLQTFIMTPRHPMPAIPLELSEIRDVVAYIESLK
jgi:mono/diheme cytochrome c family protein